MTGLLIRADAGPRIGSGHLMRCLSLALGWQARGGSVTLLSHCESNSLRRRIENAGINFLPLERPHPDPSDQATTLSTVKQLAPICVVVDGYHFDSPYQQDIRAAVPRLMVIDDMAHLPYYSADLVLNQNLHAERLTYRCDPDTKLLLGTDYVLLRPEFSSWRSWSRETQDMACKLLVTMGGSDPDNVTVKVIHALQQLEVPGLEAKIVVGPVNPHLETLQDAVQNSHSNLRLLPDVSDMPELMAWADIAITAGGTTSWELAFMGLPSIVLVLAENQKRLADGLDEAGVAINLGCHNQVSIGYMKEVMINLVQSPADRQKMSRLGRALVDGSGTDRVVDTLQVH